MDKTSTSSNVDALRPSIGALYDHAPLGYLTTDESGVALLCNDTLLQWVQRAQPDLIGKRWSDVLLSRVGRAYLEAQVNPLLRINDAAKEILLELVRSDGERIPVLANIVRQTDERNLSSGHALFQYSFIKAVDRLNYEQQLLVAKRQAEDVSDQLRELAIDLERRVIERTAELTAANHDLDAFAYTVSHDLRAPLRTVSGFCGLLIQDAGPKLDSTLQSYLDQIQKAVRSMNDMIDGLLQLSLGARSELEFGDIALSALAQRILDELYQQDPGRNTRWHIQPDVYIRADARLMEVVLRNLLSNAWKYSTRAPQPDIWFSAEDQAEKRVLRISDNGVGFAMQDAAQLFQPFKRLQSGGSFAGIGIGLATVRRIVERHGGQVYAKSSPGQGASFFVALPQNPDMRSQRRPTIDVQYPTMP